MNKQQLASTIWASANQMRSKIKANEYKDFILGFIFYKYLSDKEVRFFTDKGMSREIPMDGKQDDDVLGFIYEYLISMFAADAGKRGVSFTRLMK